MKKEETKAEVIEVVPVETGLSELKPFDYEKAELTAFVADYKNYVVTKETMPESLKGREKLRERRYTIEKTLKSNKKTLNDAKKRQEDMAEELLAIILPAENAIDAGIKAIEKQKEEEKARKAKEEEERLAKIEEEKRLAMEQELQAEKDRLETIRLEQERITKEQEEKAEALRLKEQEFLKKQEEVRLAQEKEMLSKKLEAEAELKKKEDELKARQDKLMREEQEAVDKKRREQEEVDAKIKADQEKIEEERKKLRDQKIINRANELYNLGFKYNGEELFLKTSLHFFAVANLDLKVLNDDQWNSLMLDITPKVEEGKAADKKLADEEEANRIAEQKAAEETEAKKQEALRPDKEKLLSFASELESMIFPELSGEVESKRVLEQAQATILGLQDYIRKAVAHL